MKIGNWKLEMKDLIWIIICLVLVIAFVSGLVIKDNKNAANVISGASTVVSIVLSLVAILYTMIEGANSANVNHNTIVRLTEIDNHITRYEDKLKDIKELISGTLPTLISDAEKMQAFSVENGIPQTDPAIVERLRSFEKLFAQDANE